MNQTALDEPKVSPDEFPILGDLFFAVFNCRDADKRKGRAAVIDKFGIAGWKKVLKINRTGVMAMFNQAATPETHLYAVTMGRSVEARAARESSTPQPTTPG